MTKQPDFIEYLSGKMVPGYRCATFRTRGEASEWYEGHQGSKIGRMLNAADSLRLPEADE